MHSNPWYQEAVINGVAMPARRKDGDTSEYRWRTFVEPFLPDGRDRHFLELGSNAGFYLRKARALGYKATGVERNPLYLSQAAYWEEQEPVGVQTIEGDLNRAGIPLSHTVLLANIIYWLNPKQVRRLIFRLRRRALNVIVIGRHTRLKNHCSDCRKEAVKAWFQGWEAIEGHTDHKHYSILFKNPELEEVNIDDVEIYHYNNGPKKDTFERAFTRFLKKTNNGSMANIMTTHYYKYLVSRGVKRKKRRVLCERYMKLLFDIKDRGLVKPIQALWIDGKLRLIDGDHRYLIAKFLGIKKVICRTQNHRFIPSRWEIKKIYHGLESLTTFEK